MRYFIRRVRAGMAQEALRAGFGGFYNLHRQVTEVNYVMDECLPHRFRLTLPGHDDRMFILLKQSGYTSDET
jgi:hypothetical protein